MVENINRWSPLCLGRGIVLRNRVVVPAMASATARIDGYATPMTLDHYWRLARSGAGLINVEYTFVSQSGRSEENQLGASTDGHIAGLSQIADAIKCSGAVAGLQLVHGGGKSTRDLTGGVLLGASAIAVPAKDRVLEVPAAMDLGDVAKWKDAFVAAAGRASKAGFDLIEIHASHGYGFNQWLSPLTNQRQDEYGGSLQNRMRLLREVVADIRRSFPKLILAARLPGQDFMEGGLSVADMQTVSRVLVAAGLDLVSISSGLGGWRRPGDRTMEGYLVEEAAVIQAHLACPVIGVGGIETGAYIDSVLAKGVVSLAAVGRAILADPTRWRQLNLGDSHGRSSAVS